MTRTLLLSFVLFATNFSQTLLLDENYDYGSTSTDLVTASSSIWSNHSGGTGSDDVQYLSAGLSYFGYASSGIGGAASVLNSRTGDDNRTFSSQNSGSVYLSALVNLAIATTSASGEYFLHFGNLSNQYAKLFVRSASSNLQFGLSKLSETPSFSTTNFSFNTTYLIVIKYTFISGAQNDRVDLWVFTSGVPTSEIGAGTPTIENLTAANNDAISLSAISLRQGGSVYSALVDGIRISDSWSQAPLPVELSSFSAINLDNTVKLNWRTETEVSNYGFEILRAHTSTPLSVTEWDVLGFVEGHGNSNSPKEYSFTDDLTLNPALTHTLSYRLKQIDTDGSFEYSKVIEIDLGSPAKFELSQNYPNPFNPVTTIQFTLPQPGNVKLILYNILGEQVAELVNEFKDAGVHTINFNAFELNSGVYIYKLESNGFVQSRKMMLVK